MNNINTKNLFFIYLTIFLTAVLGSIFVNLGNEWFNNLIKPKEWIPNFLIPVVWTIIYVLFSVIYTFLYKNNYINKKIIVLSTINCILNVLWCLIFFTFNQLLLGYIFIVLNAMFGTLLLTQLNKIKLWYIKFLWLYPFWLYIATFLNIAVWILN